VQKKLDGRKVKSEVDKEISIKVVILGISCLQHECFPTSESSL
jgi:hypothetical protein